MNRLKPCLFVSSDACTSQQLGECITHSLYFRLKIFSFFHFLSLKRFCSHLALILTLFDLVMVDDLLPCQDKMYRNLNLKSEASVLAECSHYYIGRGPRQKVFGWASSPLAQWDYITGPPQPQHFWQRPKRPKVWEQIENLACRPGNKQIKLLCWQ